MGFSVYTKTPKTYYFRIINIIIQGAEVKPDVLKRTDWQG